VAGEKEGRSVSDELREYIRKSGLTLAELEDASKVSASQLSRFLNQKRGLSTTAVDKLCETLHIGLTPLPGPPPALKKKKRDRRRKKD
jgi:transcriptional regulator with XRE-family HTH domain